SLGPTLRLTNDRGSSSGILGGPHWAAAWLDEMDEGWTSPGSDLIQQYIRRQNEKGWPGELIENSTEISILSHAARARKLNLVVDLEGLANGRWSGFKLPAEPQDALYECSFRFDLSLKPRGQVQLMRPTHSITHLGNGLVAWSDRKRLTQVVKRGAGFLDLPSLFWLSQQSYPALASLVADYGDVNVNTDQLTNRGAWHGIFSFFHHLPPKQQKKALRGHPIRYGETPAEARVALADSDEDYHRSIAARMEAQPGALVSLRIEPAEIDVLNQPGQPKNQQGKNVVWEIQWGDGQITRRTYPLQAVPFVQAP
ncbi:MAG TPA: hypothetical protein VK689_19750, partial [Armatimonadota bacterium]|nr:hypothetical protein [Armatimonadota bacterium]